MGRVYLRIVLDFFENSPCSNLLHIGHCIPPSSHGCVGLVGGDMHLCYNSVWFCSNINDHLGFSITFTFPPSFGFKRFLATLQSASFLSPLIWYLFNGQIFGKMHINVQKMNLSGHLFWKKFKTLQTTTLWSINWAKWPAAKEKD